MWVGGRQDREDGWRAGLPAYLLLRGGWEAIRGQPRQDMDQSRERNVHTGALSTLLLLLLLWWRGLQESDPLDLENIVRTECGPDCCLLPVSIYLLLIEAQCVSPPGRCVDGSRPINPPFSLASQGGGPRCPQGPHAPHTPPPPHLPACLTAYSFGAKDPRMFLYRSLRLAHRLVAAVVLRFHSRPLPTTSSYSSDCWQHHPPTNTTA